MDVTDLNRTIHDHAGETRGLRRGVGKIQLGCQAVFKKVQMLGKAYAGHTKLEAMHLLGVHPRQLIRQKITLLLIISLVNNPVARPNNRFKQLHRPFRWDDFPFSESLPHLGKLFRPYGMSVGHDFYALLRSRATIVNPTSMLPRIALE